MRLAEAGVWSRGIIFAILSLFLTLGGFLLFAKEQNLEYSTTGGDCGGDELQEQRKALEFRRNPASELFSSNVFHDGVMKDRLPKATYKALQATIKKGATLDATVADAVALAMKEWAIEKGATHYATSSTR